MIVWKEKKDPELALAAKEEILKRADILRGMFLVHEELLVKTTAINIPKDKDNGRAPSSN